MNISIVWQTKPKVTFSFFVLYDFINFRQFIIQSTSMSTPPNYVYTYTCEGCGTVTKYRSTIKRHRDDPAICRGMFYGIKRNKLPLSDFLGLGLGKKGRVMVRNWINLTISPPGRIGGEILKFKICRYISVARPYTSCRPTCVHYYILWWVESISGSRVCGSTIPRWTTP